MDNSLKSYLDMNIKYILISIFLFIFYENGLSQRNCNVYKNGGDECRYEACIYLEQAPRVFQLTKQFHDIYDKAIKICPEYSDAYRAKSVAYLKTGDFINWKRLMDKAIDINPTDHLGYRGWCKFQFLRDYRGAIEDIELLEKLSNYDIGPSQNGMYHLQIAKALCYKMIGQKEKAISIIEFHLSKIEGEIGLYDYYHLGVLYFEDKKYAKAIDQFNLQIEEFDFAENTYFKTLARQKLGKSGENKENLKRAIALYKNGICLHDQYTHQIDKVYLEEIQSAFDKIKIK